MKKSIVTLGFLFLLGYTGLHAQNVGVNTTAPVNKLQVGNVPSGISGYNFAIGNGTKAMAFKQATGPSIWYSDTNFALMPLSGNIGYVGIGTTTPANNLQVGSVGATGYKAYPFAIGNGTQASVFYQTATTANWLSKTNIILLPGDSSGFVGINTETPRNKLQIGDVGTSVGNYALAFGKSAFGNAGGISQWYSETNIALLPGSAQGSGRVGINTTSPICALDVEGTYGIAPYNSYAILEPLPGSPISIGSTGNGSPATSIYAQYAIVSGYGVYSASDARIKDIKGYSNTAADLATLRAIKVTDYAMKDKMSSGSKPFKKVIAQQVEGVYPQVISKRTDFIPDVYQKATVTKSASGYLLTFGQSHNLGKGEKRLKVFVSKGSVVEKFNIVSVPSDKEIIVDATSIKDSAVFVYGGEVDDFRTVDYDGLSTLNISATQELAKQLEEQKAEIKTLKETIGLLTEAVKKLQSK